MKMTGLLFLSIGIIALTIQNIFYGYIDNDGVLQDSIFLPFGVTAILVGIVCIGIWSSKVVAERLL